MIYFLTGTTASGKSTLAHKLAIEYEMKIISLDSMAVYKDIDILSDKPDKKMREEVQYFGIDIVDQETNFTVFDYISYLSEMNLDKISYNEDLIAVGGTGLYFKALTEGFVQIPNVPMRIRSKIRKLQNKLGQDKFYSKLQKIDPLVKNKIEKNDSQRSIRAYEIKYYTKKSLFKWFQNSKKSFLIYFLLEI